MSEADEQAGIEVSGDTLIPLDPGFGERFKREKRPPCQLYLISPVAPGADFAEQLAAALDGGPVAAFQLRLKDLPDDEVLRWAGLLQPVCAARDVAFLINDRADLALACGADGVHLGQGDGSVAAARALLGADAQIGVTCHASRHLAMEAAEAGADYVAFGAFHDTTTKPSEHRPDASILSWWTTISQLPCVAIGGITPANAAPLIEAGADFIAVSAGVWNDERGVGAAVADIARVLA